MPAIVVAEVAEVSRVVMGRSCVCYMQFGCRGNGYSLK
jgi:hypothetical protein